MDYIPPIRKFKVGDAVQIDSETSALIVYISNFDDRHRVRLTNGGTLRVRERELTLLVPGENQQLNF